MTIETNTVLEDIADERLRQFKKWGTQHREDGTSNASDYIERRELARELCDLKEKNGPKPGFTGGATWTHVLTEEMFEALCEVDLEALRKELIQTAAVCVAWIEDIDARKR